MNQPGYYAPNPYPQPPVYPYPPMPQQPKLGWRPRLVILGISLFLYLIALCSPVIRFEGGNNNLTWYRHAAIRMAGHFLDAVWLVRQYSAIGWHDSAALSPMDWRSGLYHYCYSTGIRFFSHSESTSA